MKNKDIYYWTCDKSESSGEGKLSLFYLETLKKRFNIHEIKKPNIKNKIIRKIIYYKYIIPFIGIIFCWIYYINKKRICYVNYLPFWNFVIFLLLPPNSNIGPITGGANFRENSNLIRKIIFPIFYKISEIIVNLRKFDLIFSTDLLKNFLSKDTIRNSSFNFIVKNFKYKKKKLSKSLDFLIYFRKHKNKINFFPVNFIQNLVEAGFKVNVIGDKLNISKVKNYGFVNNKKSIKLQQKSKYTIFSEENLYSLFTLECISNNVIVLINKSYNHKIIFFKNRFIKVDFDNPKELHKLKKIYKS